MSINNFPPQAYTRDTLSAAYEWLRDQPGSIRELAQDSDSLVALFMQSRRRSGSPNHSTQMPVTLPTQNQTLASTENFKEDLKVLAQGLKQFENPKQPTPKREDFAKPPPQEFRTPEFRAPEIKTPEPKIIEPQTQTIALDAKSLSLIIEIQKRLNLSCPNEAMRMIITVGADRVRDILPKS